MTLAMDTIKDPGFRWNIHPGMTLGSSLGQDDTLALGGTATQVGIVQLAVWLPDTQVVTPILGLYMAISENAGPGP